MKSLNKILTMITAFSVFCAVFVMTGVPEKAYATEDDSISYILTYPDGSTESVTDKAEAEKKLNEWKKLYDGQTDPNGVIQLEGWAGEGELRIVEKEVPAGYTAESTETITDLSAKETSIINKKIEKKPEEPVTTVKTDDGSTGVLGAYEEEDVAETYASGSPKSSNGAKTGDDTLVSLWIAVLLASIAGFVYLVRRVKRS